LLLSGESDKTNDDHECTLELEGTLNAEWNTQQ